MDRTRIFLTFTLALSLIGGIALGCNTGTEEPKAPASDSTSASAAKPAEPTEVVPEIIDPSRFPTLAEGVEAAVPENYPADLPIYPGAVPAQGRGATDDDGDMAAVQLLTNDAPDRAYEYYKGELESKGWSIEKADNAGGTASIAAIKDGCKATFMIVPSESGTGSDIFTISACAGEM